MANIGLKHDGFVLGKPQPFASSNENHTFWQDDWDWRRFRLKPFHDGSEHFSLYDLEPQLDYIGQKLDLTFRKRPTLCPSSDFSGDLSVFANRCSGPSFGTF